jgi:putative oxidoreductase
MHRFLSSSPIWNEKGLATIRIVVGLLMIYHGQEIFNPELMKSYEEWETFKGPMAKFMVYAGKGSELLAGISLFLGLFTRVGCVLMIGIFSYITFMMGHGKFWYEDQHPFMFLLFGVLFIFTGPGAWSLDGVLFKNRDD